MGAGLQVHRGTDTIDYQLYSDAARTQVWGDTAGTTVGGTGSGAPQSIPVFGRVPAQGPKSEGSYQDTITATVNFKTTTVTTTVNADSEQIPTLSEWGLTLLTLLLSWFGLRRLSNRPQAFG